MSVDSVANLLKGYPEVASFFGFNSNSTSDCSKFVLTQIEGYIDTHKWLLNEKIPFNITLEQAFFSWYENVFRPQVFAMQQTHIIAFTGQENIWSVFDKVSKRRYFAVSMGHNNYTYEEACNYIIKTVAGSWLKKFFVRLFAKK